MEEWRDAARGFKSRQSHTGPRAFLPYEKLARIDWHDFFPITKQGKGALSHCSKMPMIALRATTTLIGKL